MEEIKCPKCGEVFKVDESGYAAIVKQVRDKEFSDELKSRETQYKSEKDSAVQLAKLESEKDFNEKLNQKDAEISKLKAEIESFNKDKQIEINDLVNKMNSEISEKENSIAKLKNEKELNEKEYLLKEQSLKNQYEDKLRFKDEEIERYKDFKARLSTKMIGETLEQHCQNSFNQIRQTAFPNAYFEKDNDAKTGSKGDYIYRDFDIDGLEYISIMFEMKNESDTTATKKKNEDFFAELDKDRKQKKCEYAVLVSMLEADSELYNSGIVDVSYRYDKMYVIRPQFFIPIISILRNAAMNTLEAKHELKRAEAKNIDIVNLGIEINSFKDKWFKNVIDTKKRYDDAISGIDKAIKNLQDIKEALRISGSHLDAANNKVEDLTIEKLTKNSPLLKAEYKSLSIEDKKKKKK